MVDTDELRNPWVDGAPPLSLVRGRKRSDPIKTLSVPFQATFAGWIDFEDGVKCVVVYGRMEGIRFVFHDKGRSDSHFGNTRTSAGLAQQTYDVAGSGKRISCIASEPIEAADQAEEARLPHIQLLTKDQRAKTSLDVQVESACLAGIQFSFCSDRIVDWQPLFRFAGLPKGRSTAWSKSIHLRDHWKSPAAMQAWPLAETDSNVLGKFAVLADFLGGADDLPLVDGVRGYVRGNRFCGLRFRRQGLWDELALGQASAFETQFLLEPGERFTSILVCETQKFGRGGALALCTSHGRSSPWIGNSVNGICVRKVAPADRTMVGIYMAYSDPDCCDVLGIIHDQGCSTHDLDKAAPSPPSAQTKDVNTELDWAVDPRHLPARCSLTTQSRFDDVIKPRPHRAFSVFEPQQLESIEAFVNPVRGRYGLKALRFQGQRRMGTVLLGDWQARFARPSAEQTMHIAGTSMQRSLAPG